jgi:hypothetical protein
MDFKILCPACAAVLSSKKPIPNGRALTCPHCKKSFVAATSNPAAASNSGADFEFDVPGAPAVSAPTKHAPAKAAEKHTHSSIKPPVRSSGRSVAMWTVIIGLVVLAAGGGALGMYFFMMRPDAAVTEKTKGKKSSGEPVADGKVVQQTGKVKQGPRKDDKRSAKDAAKTAVAKSGGENQATASDKADAPTPAVAAPSAPAKRKTADWKEFQSAKGGYAVNFPVPPTEKMERDDDIIYYEASADLNGFQYEVTFHRLKKDDLSVPVKERLDKIAAAYKDAYVTGPKECEFEGVPKTPALELTLFRNDKKDVAVERWLVYKEHVFQICVSGDKDRLGPDQVTRFMQSFRFVADPQGGFLDLTQTTGIPPERKKK